MAHYSADSSSSDLGEGEEAAIDGVEDGHVSLNDYISQAPTEGLKVNVSDDDDDEPAEELDNGKTMTARAYQREMLEASLQGNIIVAMDTGSGKTQVAVLRIMAELDRAPPEKRMWFLAPNVSLCAQQFDVLRSQIPEVQAKFLCGADNVDAWSEQRIWDKVLLNVRIVVSTYQVLLDALSHAFIPINSLALIVFDEAHNCHGDHPGSKLMRNHYWTSKNEGLAVPHILGLTASPIVRSDLEGLEALESTLDAICKSPNRHRDELLAHVKRPEIFSRSYESKPDPLPQEHFSRNMVALQKAWNALQLKDDPYIHQLRAENSERSKKKLEEIMRKHNTPTQIQLKSFFRRATVICRELGQWAADWYIFETIRRFNSSLGTEDNANEKWVDVEAQYLASIFRDVDPHMPKSLKSSTAGLSDKVQQLISILNTYSEKPTGIVFVKERATTAVLSRLLSDHPVLNSKCRVAAMVGTSTKPGRKQDFLDLSQSEFLMSLENFRSGKVNILVATSVLEEGIDVPACNLVVCFDEPSDPKSFIQRRGRARMESSHLYLLVSKPELARDWEALEAVMKQKYEDDMRELQQIESIEQSEEANFPPLYVPSTGARLFMDQAKSHLDHFCTSLSSRRFVDCHPDYVIEVVMNDADVPGALKLLTATVILPAWLKPSLRKHKSVQAWASEKNACRDAAFQAYKALYYAGLINDNLLPLKDTNLSRDVGTRPGLMEVKEQFNPWPEVARAWIDNEAVPSRRQLRLADDTGSVMCELEVLLPCSIPEAKPVVLHWDYRTAWTLSLESDIEMGESTGIGTSHSDEDHTSVLISLAYGHRWKDDLEQGTLTHNQCVVRFVAKDDRLSLDQIGSRDFNTDMPEEEKVQYLVRDFINSPYQYQSELSAKPEADTVQEVYRGFDESPEETPYLVVRKWPKKAGFFHPPPAPELTSKKPYPRVLPAFDTRADSAPLAYAQFGMLIPSIINYLELYLVASKLLSTVLAPIGIADISLVAMAISASSARGPSNYERIEFLGDSLLKLFTTVNASAQHLDWPEGLLSLLKDKIISNARLCRASVESGLDQFIITRQLRLDKWRPPYIKSVLKAAELANKTRQLSTKTLADVVEALIGASYQDGDFPKALRCISTFLNDVEWTSLDDARQALFDAAISGVSLPPPLAPVEDMLGYTFQKKSLLIESMTHASYNTTDTIACLDRLEFLGDAILDHIIVKKLFAVDNPPIENFDMHLFRTALVNGDILGFLVMEWTHKQQQFDAVDNSSAQQDHRHRSHQPPPTLVASEVSLPLWRFMRFSSPELALEQRLTTKRHATLRESIWAAIRGGTHYPWALLARLRAQKFFSDIFESLIGAIWVDSGSLDACEALVERAGILEYLHRILRDKVHVLHPKEELGRVAERETVEYEVENVKIEDGTRQFSCKVLVGGREVVSVDGALYKEEAKTRAAEEAIKVLKAEKSKTEKDKETGIQE